MVRRRTIFWGVTSTKVINIIGREVALEMMKKSDSIGSTLTSHCGSMKTKRKNSVKKTEGHQRSSQDNDNHEDPLEADDRHDGDLS